MAALLAFGTISALFSPIKYGILPDHLERRELPKANAWIEAATFAAVAAMTGGTIRLENVVPDHFEAALRKLEESGCVIRRAADAVTVSGPARPRPVSVVTRPFPGFPTDMQAQMIAVCAIGEGTSVIEDTIYLDRFTHVPELARMGARIELKGNVAVVKGVDRLAGAQVMATDLRASASLVIAALAAQGETLVDRIYHLDRGYEALEQKLAALGADIERIH